MLHLLIIELDRGIEVCYNHIRIVSRDQESTHGFVSPERIGSMASHDDLDSQFCWNQEAEAVQQHLPGQWLDHRFPIG
jgi:hypothetical protein